MQEHQKDQPERNAKSYLFGMIGNFKQIGISAKQLLTDTKGFIKEGARNIAEVDNLRRKVKDLEIEQ